MLSDGFEPPSPRYQPGALPNELRERNEMAPAGGIESPACRLQDGCSTLSYAGAGAGTVNRTPLRALRKRCIATLLCQLKCVALKGTRAKNRQMDGQSAADPEFNPGTVARLPVQYLDVHDVKQHRVAYRHAGAPLQARTRSWDRFRSLFEASAGHVSLSPCGEGPGPAAGYLLDRTPLSGCPVTISCSCFAIDAPAPHQSRCRLNDSAAVAAGVLYARSERMVILLVSHPI